MNNLKAYQVGDCDVVAAYDEAGAIRVLEEMCGYTDGEFSHYDVKLVSSERLDSKQAFDIDEGVMIDLESTLREDIAAMTEPTYCYGWE